MKILLDTNVVMDIIEKREPFYKDSVAALKRMSAINAKCYFSASSAKDVFYLVKRHTGSIDQAKNAIVSISKFAVFCDTTKQDVQDALLSSVVDFEDAILVASAMRDNLDIVVTRNVKDFSGTVVLVMTPTEFLRQH